MILKEGFKFSVIIPTYNRAEYLNELLQCLENQTFKDFEVLVCDDGSTDNTRDVVAEFTHRLQIRYFYETNWGGPARPRNIGVKNAVGEYLCFVDSDDLWEDNKLYEMSKALKPGVDVIFHLFQVRNTKQIIGNYKQSLFLSDLKNLLYNGGKIVNSSLCIRKTLIESIGGFSEEKKFIAVEDFDLLVRLANQKAKFLLIKKVLGTYRLNETNISGNFAIQIKKFELLLNHHVAQFNFVSKLKTHAVVNYMKGSYLLDLHRNKFARKFLVNSFLYGSATIRLKSLFRLITCTI